MTLSDYSRGEQDGRSPFKKAVHFVCLVSLVYRVSPVQPNKRDKPNKPERPAGFTGHGYRERRSKENTSLGKEAVLAASGRAGDVATGVWRAKRLTVPIAR